jgi:hypothetical protein
VALIVVLAAIVLAAMIIAIPVAARIEASPGFLKLKEGLSHKQGIARFLRPLNRFLCKRLSPKLSSFKLAQVWLLALAPKPKERPMAKATHSNDAVPLALDDVGITG